MNRYKNIPVVKRGWKYLLLTFTLLAGVLLSGCNPVIDGYREFRVSRGIACFSFEYPSGWHLGNIRTEAAGTIVNSAMEI